MPVGGWLETRTQTIQPSLILGEKGIWPLTNTSEQAPKAPDQWIFNLASRKDCPTVFPERSGSDREGQWASTPRPGSLTNCSVRFGLLQ
jgi:hypothetical protein